eukprot:TRINITY_DN67399_c6_g1_i8.p2 TRINITY_DN67399_c6_g1~~TRINITY_DN67399_c6_g1_i8.p2  ORF type:complete len:102 (-),score=9.33 TRINITY_DN67399_c6_g1_i8:393-698(-)
MKKDFVQPQRALSALKKVVIQFSCREGVHDGQKIWVHSDHGLPREGASRQVHSSSSCPFVGNLQLEVAPYGGRYNEYTGQHVHGLRCPCSNVGVQRDSDLE